MHLCLVMCAVLHSKEYLSYIKPIHSSLAFPSASLPSAYILPVSLLQWSWLLLIWSYRNVQYIKIFKCDDLQSSNYHVCTKINSMSFGVHFRHLDRFICANPKSLKANEGHSTRSFDSPKILANSPWDSTVLSWERKILGLCNAGYIIH